MAAYPQQGEAGQSQTGAPVQATATHVHTPKQRDAVRSWATLTLAIIVIALVCGMVALVVMGRYKRRVFGSGGKRKKTRRGDAWAESGKRMDTPPPPPPDAEDGSRDDTVDIDPGDLGPGDVGPGSGGEGFDPHGEPPPPPNGGGSGRRGPRGGRL